MKTAIFTWLFLLPVQMFAGSYNSQISDELPIHATTQEVSVNSNSIAMENVNLISSAEVAGENLNYQAIAVSQEKDIQKLKSQLAHKNHEINSQELTQWKSQSSTLIFFVGMLIFAFLYIRSKLQTDDPELITISNYNQAK